MLVDSGDTKGAESQFAEALQLSPNDLGARVSYGKYLSKAGRRDEAMTQFKKALEINPHCLPAQTGLSLLEKTK